MKNAQEETSSDTATDAERSDAEDPNGRDTVFGDVPVRRVKVQVTGGRRVFRKQKIQVIGGGIVYRKARLAIRKTPED